MGFNKKSVSEVQTTVELLKDELSSTKRNYTISNQQVYNTYTCTVHVRHMYVTCIHVHVHVRHMYVTCIHVHVHTKFTNMYALHVL